MQEKVFGFDKSGKGLSSVVSVIKKETDVLGRAICIEVIKALDTALVKDSSRKKKWYVERKNEEKSVITMLGEITY